jgi:NAD(P)-dependent dehydrogenase (short-subunit alcohol dehydrogenase family)
VKYYAVTLGPKQIRVNAIIPGLTIKPEARAFYDSHPELEALYKDITPLGRMGTVEDLAHLVDFLISEKSSYLTGQTITLDGGIGLRSAWSLARKVSPSVRDLQVTQRKAAK